MYGGLGSIRLHAATSGRGAVARLRLPLSPAAPPAAEAPPATAPLAAGPAAEQPS
jgi:hypothetical protein